MGARTLAASGRLCRECGGRSRMKSWLRHLHELSEGARFIVEDTDPDTLGEWRVIEQSPASVRVAPVVPVRVTRKITPRFSDPVEITVESHGWRRMAPTTQVIPCAAGVALVLVPSTTDQES